MDDDDGSQGRWQEPPAGLAAVLLRAGGIGICFVLGATSVLSASWDGVVVAAVIAAALAADLWRDLRPRQFVLAGPDLLVVSTARRTTSVRWEDIAGVGRRRRRFRSAAPLVLRLDGTAVDLPARTPLDDVRGWIERRPREGESC